MLLMTFERDKETHRRCCGPPITCSITAASQVPFQEAKFRDAATKRKREHQPGSQGARGGQEDSSAPRASTASALRGDENPTFWHDRPSRTPGTRLPDHYPDVCRLLHPGPRRHRQVSGPGQKRGQGDPGFGSCSSRVSNGFVLGHLEGWEALARQMV